MAKRKHYGLGGTLQHHNEEAVRALDAAEHSIDSAIAAATSQACSEALRIYGSAMSRAGVALAHANENKSALSLAKSARMNAFYGQKITNAERAIASRCLRSSYGMSGLGEGEGGSNLVYAIGGIFAVGLLMLMGKSGVSAEDLAKAKGTQKKG